MDKCTAKIKHSIKASKPKLLEAEVTLLRSRSYLEAGCFTRVGSGLTHKHLTRLEKLARDKHSSLLRKLVTYSRKQILDSTLKAANFSDVFVRQISAIEP